MIISDRAKRAAYEIGLIELAPFLQSIMNLEQRISELTARVEALEKSGTPAHLRNVEKRAGT